MTVNVAAVGQDATLKQVAEAMVDRGVSGIPVVNAERHVLGVVSEADLIAKEASRPESAGILGRFLGAKVDDHTFPGTTSGEIMTCPAVTIEPEDSVPETACMMIEEDVNRLPVVRDGRLVGIVSRADLVRAFLRSDSEIEEELRTDVLLRQLWIPEDLDITVTGGKAKIAGAVRTKIDADLVEAFAWRVPGVVSVDCSELTVESDDRERV